MAGAETVCSVAEEIAREGEQERRREGSGETGEVGDVDGESRSE